MNIQELKENFKGRVITRDDVDYDITRKVFYGGIDKKPAAIIRVVDASDIRKAVELAKDTGMEIAIRSGGHSFAGYSMSDGGIVIDLREMKRMDIDTQEKILWAETGLTAREVAEELDKHNLVLGFGDTGSVGIGGITLGGGIGYLTRKYGMTIDNLLAAEIVTADGDIKYVDKDNHPDLFWAIRGGGGNFGVVTKFKYRVQELGDVLGGLLILPALEEVISNFISISEKAPNELSSILNVMPAPPMPFIPEGIQGKMIAMAIVMYAGDPVEGAKVVAPLRELAVPYADMIRPMRYKDIFFPDDDSYHPLAVARTMYLKDVTLSSAKMILHYLESHDSPMRVVQLRVLGGAAEQVDSHATAYAHRKSRLMANVASFYDTEEEKKSRQVWVDSLANEMFQGDTGRYVAFIGPETGTMLYAYPVDTHKRLLEIKKQYDPGNLFRLNFNIQPIV